MKSKLLLVGLFVVVFLASFVFYILMANVIAPQLDISGAAKKDLGSAPPVNSEKKNIWDDSVESTGEETEIDDVKVMVPGESSRVDPDKAVTKKTVEVIDAEEASTEDNTVDVKTSEPEIIKNEEEKSVEEPVEVKKVDTPAAPILDTQNENSDEQKESKENISDGTIYRVIVGNFSSEEKANEAIEKIESSNSTLSPIVKQDGGRFTIQVAAFSNESYAENLQSKLKGDNFTAKVTASD